MERSVGNMLVGHRSGYKNNGLGQALVGKLLQESRELGIEKYLPSYQPAF